MTRANPKVVGGFIIGGTLLLLLAIAALVSGKFFTHSTTLVSFFPESVRGLQIGSPVTFRGVPLGQVTAIEAYMVHKDAGIDIEVTYQVNLDRIHDPAGTVSELQGQGPRRGGQVPHREGAAGRAAEHEPGHRPALHRPRLPPRAAAAHGGHPHRATPRSRPPPPSSRC